MIDISTSNNKINIFFTFIIILMRYRTAVQQVRLVTLNAYWASFDCDGCHKKIKNP
jgi:hypothetical protein